MLLLASAFLTIIPTAVALETTHSLFEPDPEHVPSLYFSAELLRLGGGGQLTPLGLDPTPEVEGWLNARLLHIGLELHRVRVGLGFTDVNSNDISTGLLDIGYTLYRRPAIFFGRVYGSVPEVYLEATAHLRSTTIYPPRPVDFTGAVSAVGAIDCYGLGASVAVGVNYRRLGPPQPHDASARNQFCPYAAIQVHVLSLRVGI